VLATLGAAGMIVACAHLAAPAGAEIVRGQVGDGPGWLRGVYGQGIPLGGGTYYAFTWLAFAGYLALLIATPSLPGRLVWGAIGVAVAAFALAPPLLSQDVFSYISYARLEALHGLNPYTSPPSAVSGDPVFAHVGWTDTVSAYGPAFTLATWPLGKIGVGAALWALKAASALSVLAVCGLCARLAAWRGVDPRLAAAFVGLNPIVLVHVVGGPHNDGLMMLAVLGGVAALLSERPLAAGAGFVLGAAIKVSGAFVAPFAFAGVPGRRGRLLLGAAIAAIAIAVVSSLAYGFHFFDSLGLAGENQATASYYSLPRTISRIAGLHDADPVRIVMQIAYAGLVVYLLHRVRRGMDWVRAAGWAAFGLLVATGWLLAWYLIWLIPLAAISRDRPLVVLTLAFTAFQLVNRIPI
jgi:alpha-1,6-mannosyltransferase